MKFEQITVPFSSSRMWIGYEYLTCIWQGENSTLTAIWYSPIHINMLLYISHLIVTNPFDMIDTCVTLCLSIHVE